MSQTIKNLPTVQETWVQSLDREDPLEKEMATHFTVLTWKIPWTEKPGRLQSIGSQWVRHNWATKRTHTFSSVQFSYSVMFDSLPSNGLQHARLPCPSPTPGALKLPSITLEMPSNHLILCHPLLLPPSVFPSIRVFFSESVHQVARVLEFQLQHQSFQWVFRTDFL